MRFISLVFILALITTSVALAHGDEHAPATDAVEEEPLVCENCGMLYQPSSTKVDVVAKVDGETAGHIFATMPCLYNHVNFFWDGEAELVTVEVLDYTTYGLKEEKMIDALKAFYLYDTKKLKGTSEPYIAAFATKEALEKAKADLGGEAVDYEEVMKRLVKDASKHSHGDEAAGDDHHNGDDDHHGDNHDGDHHDEVPDDGHGDHDHGNGHGDHC